MTNIRAVASELIIHILDGKFGFKLLVAEYEEKNKVRFKTQDLGLLHEIVYGVIRYHDLLLFELKTFLNQKTVKRKTRVLLLVSLFQHFYLDRIPSFAIVSQAMEASKKLKLHVSQQKCIRAILSSAILKTKRDYFLQIEKAKIPIWVRYSHPKWLYDYWSESYSSNDILQIMKAGQTKQVFNLNINPYRLAEAEKEIAQKFQVSEKKKLKKKSIYQYEFSAWNSELDYLLQKGLFYIQSAPQFEAVDSLPVKNGEQVLEIGAGSGGKTISLSYRAGSIGKVYAVDKSHSRIEKLSKRLNSMGLDNVELFNGDVFSDEFEEKFSNKKFDHILIDSPCSTLAELWRIPEVRFRMDINKIKELAAIQLEILNKCYSFLKFGGKLLYSTCTISSLENEKNRQRFIAQHSDANLLKEKLTYSGASNGPGGYYFLIQKDASLLTK